MKMTPEAKRFFGEELGKLLHAHVQRTLYPIATKLDASVDVIAALSKRVEELEAKLAEVDQRKMIRRIA